MWVMVMKKKNIAIYLVMLISFAYLIYNYFFNDYSRGFMMFHHYGYYDGYINNEFIRMSFIAGIAWLVLILSFLYLIIQRLRSNNDALEILNSRLAENQITIDEYRQIKKELDKS
jgi:uncharacterized membrane protein